MSSLGDLFHALPAVHSLRAGLNAEVDWVTQLEYAELVSCFADVRRVIPFHRRAFVRRLPRFLKALRAERYDYIVDLQGLLKSAVASRLARGGRRVGPSFSREGAHLLYDGVTGARNKNRHAVDECLDVVDYLGLARGAPAFPVAFPRLDANWPRPRVAVLPGSRWPTKNWPAERFAEVAARLRAERAATVLVLGTAADREYGRRIASSAGDVVDLTGRTSLVEMGSVLQEVDLLIANDSGPVHMAAAVGTPVLAIFGPTDPQRTGPYGFGHAVLRSFLSCEPCLSRTCPNNGPPCLLGVSSHRVVEMAMRMLDSRPAARESA